MENSTNKIPEYWEEHLDKKISQIRKIQAKIGVDCASFGLITDIHWVCNAKHSAALMEKVLNDCSIPYFFNAGDTVSGAGLCKMDFLIQDLNAYRESFSAIESKCIMVLGNHDMSYSTFQAPDYYAEQMTAAEIFEYIFRFETMYPNRFFSKEGSYYYVDDSHTKMRYVVLNNHDVPSEEIGPDGKPLYNKFRIFSMRQEQFDWFAHVALDVPSPEWSVVLCSHENPTCHGEVPKNYPLLLQIINAFKRHEKFEGSMEFPERDYLNVKVSVDYTGRGGDFIAWLCGHWHLDQMLVENGVTCLSTVNDSMGAQDGNRTPHVKGTDTEHSFDIFTVDKKAHTVYVTRVGLGEDRQFTYEAFDL